MNNELYVTKRNGNKETIDLEKIHRVIAWAAEGLDQVSVSQVELKQHIQFYDGLKDFTSPIGILSSLGRFFRYKKLPSRLLVVIKAVKDYLFNIGRKTEPVEISITYQKLLQFRLQCRSPPLEQLVD